MSCKGLNSLADGCQRGSIVGKKLVPSGDFERNRIYLPLIALSPLFAAKTHCFGHGNLAGWNLSTVSTNSFVGAVSLSSSEFTPLKYWSKKAST